MDVRARLDQRHQELQSQARVLHMVQRSRPKLTHYEDYGWVLSSHVGSLRWIRDSLLGAGWQQNQQRKQEYHYPTNLSAGDPAIQRHITPLVTAFNQKNKQVEICSCKSAISLFTKEEWAVRQELVRREARAIIVKENLGHMRQLCADLEEEENDERRTAEVKIHLGRMVRWVHCAVSKASFSEQQASKKRKRGGGQGHTKPDFSKYLNPNNK